jgi:adenosylcobinamide-GDP ribazoletransferase
VKNFLVDFNIAWQLRTVIPMPFLPQDFPRPGGYAAPYYALVGLILGAILAGAAHLAWLLPPALAATLLLGLWIGLTGMLHLDGFMDSCDGLLPPREPARRLEIMKDSRVGAFGVVGGVLVLLLKFNAIQAALAVGSWPLWLVIPMLARLAQTWAMVRYPLARSNGMGVLFGQGLTVNRALLAVLAAALVAIGLLGLTGVILLAVTGLLVTLVARFALARIGGLTGDVYGAICEIIETALLVVAATLAWWGVG